MSDDGACWQDMRWDFVRATLQKRSRIRLTSLPEAVRETRPAKDHSVSGEPPPRRGKGKQTQPSDNNLREAEIRTTRELAADAVWKDIWTTAPMRMLDFGQFQNKRSQQTEIEKKKKRNTRGRNERGGTI